MPLAGHHLARRRRAFRTDRGASGLRATTTPTRQPLFGQLHLHTQYSADAATVSTRNTPREAYRFAKGEPVGLAPFYDTRLVRTSDDQPPVGGVSAHPYCLPPDRCQFTASRIIKLPEGRELDFVAVTDHSEFLGETNICYFEGGLPCDTGDSTACTAAPGTFCNAGAGQTAGNCVPWGFNDPFCVAARGAVNRLTNGVGAALFVGVWQQGYPQNPPYPFCTQSTPNGEDTCATQAQNVWQRTIAAAEEAYDHTQPVQVHLVRRLRIHLDAHPHAVQPQLRAVPRDGRLQRRRPGPCLPPGQCGDPLGRQCFVGGDRGVQRRQPSVSPTAAATTCTATSSSRNAKVPPAPLSSVIQPTGCGAGQNCQAYPGPDGSAAPGAYSTRAGVSLGSPVGDAAGFGRPVQPAKTAAQFLSIPHNSNMSGGAMFLDPQTPEDAKTRAEYEKLVEIFQIKGDSECRYSPAHPLDWQPGAASPDEVCAFEDMNYATLAAGILVDPDAKQIRRAASCATR